jgi:hypothetical protein
MKHTVLSASGLVLLAAVLVAVAIAGKPAVITFHNDPASTGQNLDETILKLSNVKVKQFGKLHTTRVDGQIYGQPLYLPDVVIKAGASPGKHDVLLVATQHDSVYVLDANNGQQLWTKSFINPAGQITTVPFTDVTPNADVTPEIGITSTMALDTGTGTLYLTAKTKEVRAGKAHYVYRLHALAIASGTEQPGSPVVIGDSTGPQFADIVSGPAINGKGEGGNGVQVQFNAMRQFQRAGITLVNGRLYLAFASHGDNTPYHGWVLGYDAKNLKLTAAVNITPNATSVPGAPCGAGIWQAGGKLVVDAKGNLYFMTGNGVFDETLSGGFPNRGNYGDSFVKLAVDPKSDPAHQHINGWGLKVVDYFSPSNTNVLGGPADADLGSGGPLALPRQAGSTANPDLLVGAGKEGKIYLLNRDNMGKFNKTTDQVVQETGPGAVGGVFGTPAYFRDHNGVQRLYFGGGGTALRAFTISNAKIALPASSQTKDVFRRGPTPSISANKNQDGIVWVMDWNRNMLRAFDATDLSKELYNSGQLPADILPGNATKFSVPTIANGKVYVVSQAQNQGQPTFRTDGINSLVIYGLK